MKRRVELNARVIPSWTTRGGQTLVIQEASVAINIEHARTDGTKARVHIVGVVRTGMELRETVW